MTWESGWTLRELVPNRRAALGVALVVLGLAGILWGVFHVLDALPEPGADFAHRNTDYGDRKAVHGSFLGGLVRALAGLGIALLGARLASLARKPSNS
jgi:hypothetical protein